MFTFCVSYMSDFWNHRLHILFSVRIITCWFWNSFYSGRKLRKNNWGVAKNHILKSCPQYANYCAVYFIVNDHFQPENNEKINMDYEIWILMNILEPPLLIDLKHCIIVFNSVCFTCTLLCTKRCLWLLSFNFKHVVSEFTKNCLIVLLTRKRANI